jgi:hypothetical protein
MDARQYRGQYMGPDRWYQNRPIPVWIILALYVLQMIAILVVMARVHYLTLLSEGDESIGHALMAFSYPLLALLGAICLFLRRKLAIVFFGAHLAMGLVRLVADARFHDYLSLALVVGIFIYSLRYLLKGSPSSASATDAGSPAPP